MRLVPGGVESVVSVVDDGRGRWGPQFVQTDPVERHVPQAELTPGPEVVNSEVMSSPLFEYDNIAKSLVMSTPVTRAGLISSPCPVSRAKATQES